MPLSFNIGRLANIQIKVHFTFLLLLLWFLGMGLLDKDPLFEIAIQLTQLLAIFSFVVLHELGHALMARHYGISTRDITLLPIGGIAKLEGQAKTPFQEIAISFAGPMVNVVLAIMLFFLQYITPQQIAYVFENLMYFNIGLFLFNMLPAFPMDGGRIFRSALSYKFGVLSATEKAAFLGKVLAAGFVILGIKYNLMLALIGFFIWSAGSQELKALRARLWYQKMGWNPPL